MKNNSSINSKTLAKLLKRYKLTLIRKMGILKTAEKRYVYLSTLNRLARKIKFKESFTNKNKQS